MNSKKCDSPSAEGSERLSFTHVLMRLDAQLNRYNKITKSVAAITGQYSKSDTEPDPELEKGYDLIDYLGTLNRLNSMIDLLEAFNDINDQNVNYLTELI